MLDEKTATILFVEDNIGHARLVIKSLERAGLNNRIIHVDNGRTAVDFVFRKGEYEGKERPSPLLVFLDLNMPGMDGYEVLKRIKDNESSRSIPVFILTTSGSGGDVERCYELGCNAFITLPVEYEELSKTVRAIGAFLEIIMVPDSY